MNELGKIGNLFKKVDKDFADKIKSRLTLTDLLDPLSRAVAVLQDKHLLLDVVSKVKKLDLDQDFINNLISQTNFPGGVAGIIKATGIFLGSTKGIVNLSIQKFDAVLSAIGHFSWMMVYFSMFMPFPMIISIANNLFQLIVMNNEKVRSKLSKFFENIKK